MRWNGNDACSLKTILREDELIFCNQCPKTGHERKAARARQK
jgi:hypothetical protein